jgi:serine/threonine protein kinase
MALDVACGLEALEQHEPPILHRDLKPSNIMIDASGRAKVADMGLSRVLTPEALMELTPETGSYRYMAPEVVRHDLYATQADVWSWGCIVSELLTGVVPYSERHLTPIQVALAVADGGLRPIIPAECPPGLAELLVSILDADPMERPSAAVAAEVMRRVVEEEERKEAAERGVAAGVTAAWNRWMMKPSQ